MELYHHQKLTTTSQMGGQVSDLTWDSWMGELVVDPLHASTDQVGAIAFLYDSRIYVGKRKTPVGLPSGYDHWHSILSVALSHGKDTPS